MKTIDTLVADIYTLLEKGSATIDDVKLSQAISSRLSQSKGGPALRMSTVGEKCVRKLWYREHSPALAAPLPGNTKLNFLLGDIWDQLMPSLIEQAEHKIEAIQEEVTFEGVKGHVDCIVDGVVVDVKSANTRSMDKFKRHLLGTDDPFNYLDQIGVYAEALSGDPRVTDKHRVAFLAADKELGHLVVDAYPTPKRDWRGIIRSIKDWLNGVKVPPRFYSDVEDGKSGNRQLPLQCRYCEFKQHCWADANNGRGLRTFLFASGPRWLTKVMRTPDVKEIYTKSTEI